MFQSHFPSHQHLTSAHLAQTMTLLGLTAVELRQKIETELAKNPALELIEEKRCPTCHRILTHSGPCPICSLPQGVANNDPIVFVSPREDFYSSQYIPADDLPIDHEAAETEDLASFVLRQIAPELAVKDRGLAAYILTHLNEDGFLSIEPIEIAQYHHIPVDHVNKIISLIQHSDPIGVGSANPQEVLLIQLEVLSEVTPVPPLAKKIIGCGLDLLSRHQYSELARILKTSVRQIQQVAQFISENLNPFPARSHWGDHHSPSESPLQVYRQPDIIINYLNGNPENPFVVEIIMPLKGTLRVNPLFRQAIREADPGKIEEWKNELEQASLLVKCIQQRNHTMRRLMQRVVVLQENFIRSGETQLIPLTRVQISKELEVHESTISRAVANKTIQLPNRRIVPLSTFFDRSLNVRSIMRIIIENDKDPLSDTEIAQELGRFGFKVARRTVAKYRSMEGILPAHLRHPNPVKV